MGEVRIASGRNRARVDYLESGKQLTKVFENLGNRIISTLFNGDGEILDRGMAGHGNDHVKMAIEFAGQFGTPIPGEYVEIRVLKPCPKCGGRLSYDERERGAVLPLLTCRSCGVKAFGLTDSYLSRLIGDRQRLFDGSEVSMLRKNPDEFMAELKGHIIRIYASKHIMRIL